ncbi:oligosaccharide flippase family protein [Flavimarina sp. Hel_I_48]|uniref:oligosaccharide flippase family protein n=1 Tax=Flavimarina sp. Hel_I_48 TaxID=1392488 RepID=UPI0004DF2B8F|nr:oligosaccharide flippase family protein [Flavimarina sp. Hel_I_48]
MAKLLKNTVYYSIGNFITKALSFLLLPLYLKYLTPDDYGIVNSMQVFSGIILIFFTLGLERSIYRLFFDYKTESEKKDFLGTVSLSILVLSISICLLLFLLNRPVGEIYKSIPFAPFYVYAIITAFFATFELVPLISFQVKQQAGKYLLFSLLLLTVKVLPVIWFVIFKEEGALGMLKGAAVGGGLSLIFLLPATVGVTHFTFKMALLKKTLRYCLPLVPLVLSAWIVNMSDRIFIERYFGTYSVGIYSLGYKIGQLVQFAAVAVLMAYNPLFYKLANSEDKIRSKSKLFQVNNILVVFMLLVTFVVAFLSKDIIYLFFDKEYQVTYTVIPLIAFGTFFIQMISLQNLSFHQEKKTLVIMNINLVAAGVNIALNFLLIKNYGYLGAAWATLITQVLFFLLVYKIAKRYYFIPYKWKEIVPLFILFALFVIINTFYLPAGLTFLLLKVGFILIVGFLIILYKWKSILLLKTI